MSLVDKIREACLEIGSLTEWKDPIREKCTEEGHPPDCNGGKIVAQRWGTLPQWYDPDACDAHGNPLPPPISDFDRAEALAASHTLISACVGRIMRACDRLDAAAITRGNQP